MLVDRLGRKGDALHMLTVATPTTAVMGIAAYLINLPLLFPSLGPTIYMVFEWPMSEASSPRNTLIGHYVAIVVGFACLWLFGLVHEPSVLDGGIGWPRIAAAALALGVAETLLLLLHAEHPPAGATVLIVSLGFLSTPSQLLAMAGAILLLTAIAWLMNRAWGIPVPLWRAAEQTEPQPGAARK